MTFPNEYRRLKYAVEGCFNGVWGDEPNGVDDLVVVRVADFDREKASVRLGENPTVRAIPPSARNRRVLKREDLLIEKSGGGEQQSVGNVVLFDDERQAVCSNFVARMPVTEGCNARYLAYVFRSMYSEAKNIPHIKQTSGIQNLDSESYLNELAWLPTLDRQERIANFLDEKTARIDALIAEKERLLLAVRELFLAKLGTAVVEGVAGRGTLRNEVAKGFESVRTDWALVPLKHLTAVSGGMTPSKDKPEYWEGGIHWVSPKDMKRFEIGDSADHVTQKALDETALRLHSPDSVLVVVRGMILAHTFPVALTTAPVTINQDMKALRSTGRISPKYLAWMLRGLQSLMLSLTEESAHGTKALRTDQWANQPVPVPSPEEQAERVTLFEQWSAETLQLSEHLDEHIDRLREYRSSWISAAVTGQLDVGAVKEAT